MKNSPLKTTVDGGCIILTTQPKWMYCLACNHFATFPVKIILLYFDSKHFPVSSSVVKPHMMRGFSSMWKTKGELLVGVRFIHSVSVTVGTIHPQHFSEGSFGHGWGRQPKEDSERRKKSQRTHKKLKLTY